MEKTMEGIREIGDVVLGTWILTSGWIDSLCGSEKMNRAQRMKRIERRETIQVEDMERGGGEESGGGEEMIHAMRDNSFLRGL